MSGYQRLSAVARAGLCNKMSQAGWAVKSSDVLATVLEAGVQGQGAGTDDSPLAGCRLPASCLPSRGGRKELALRGSCYKGTNPIHGGSTHMT